MNHDDDDLLFVNPTPTTATPLVAAPQAATDAATPGPSSTGVDDEVDSQAPAALQRAPRLSETLELRALKLMTKLYNLRITDEEDGSVDSTKGPEMANKLRRRMVEELLSGLSKNVVEGVVEDLVRSYEKKLSKLDGSSDLEIRHGDSKKSRPEESDKKSKKDKSDKKSKKEKKHKKDKHASRGGSGSDSDE